MGHPNSHLWPLLQSRVPGPTLSSALRSLCHEVIIEIALALGEPAADNMLILFRHLLLNIHLNSAQQKGPQNLTVNNQHYLMTGEQQEIEPQSSPSSWVLAWSAGHCLSPISKYSWSCAACPELITQRWVRGKPSFLLRNLLSAERQTLKL